MADEKGKLNREEHEYGKVGDVVNVTDYVEELSFTGERAYGIMPDTYAGPWKLRPGTKLKVVRVPK